MPWNSSANGRRQTACAAIAGLAMLAGNAFAEPVAGLEDTPPSLAPPGRAATDMPQPLPPRLATRIRRIFALQSAGDMTAAERESSRLPLDTPLRRAMLGHILADRY